MSNHAHRRRRHPKVDTADRRKSENVALAIAGCTCRPIVVRRHVDGVLDTTFQHTDGCPAINAPDMLTILPSSHRRGGGRR